MPKGKYNRKTIAHLNYEEISWIIHSLSIVELYDKQYSTRLAYWKGVISKSDYYTDCTEVQNLKFLWRFFFMKESLSFEEHEIFDEIEEKEKLWRLYKVLILPEDIETLMEFYERITYKEDFWESIQETYWNLTISRHYKMRGWDWLEYQIKWNEKLLKK